MAAACAFHEISPEDCGDRLHLDSGLVQPLCTAIEDRDGFALAEEVFVQLAATITDRQISAVVVDPFVSSHAVQENSNGAIDAITKRWKRLAQETGCAVVLVHHTKKLGGREVTAEDGRGAVALRDAARVVLPLNPMGEKDAEELGISDPALRRSLVRIDEGKVSRAPAGAATWIKLEGQSLDNGSGLEPVRFCRRRHAMGKAGRVPWPGQPGTSTWSSKGLSPVTAGRVCRPRIGLGIWSPECRLSAETDKGRIKAILLDVAQNGALAVEHRTVNGRDVPFVIAGKPVDPSEIGIRPHLQTCGAEGAESAEDDRADPRPHTRTSL